MALTPRLDLRQSQSLVMTPQLQQAIKLLQLSNLELSAFVERELEENPLLEREENPAEPTTTAEDDFEADGDDGDFETADFAATDDPRLEGVSGMAEEKSLDVDYDNVWNNDSPADAGGLAEPAFAEWSSRGGGFDENNPDLEQTLSGAVSLRDHVMEQIAIELHTPAERMIATHLLDLLDDTGYLGPGWEAVAEVMGCAVADVETVLAHVQHFDPPGIFARDLAECLALQLRDRNRLDPAMQALLDNLDLLAKRDVKGLLAACGVDQEDLTDMVAEIRALDPKPALTFDAPPAQPITPDILMRPHPSGGWVVELNSETLPRVLVNNHYFSFISKNARNSKDKQYINERFQTANWLVKSLDQRANTILKVATEIVRQQDGFFAKGVQHLRPLVLRDIAEVIDMHESTVSRVTSNKYMATPRGIFELKYFFTPTIASASGGEGHSAESVRHRIKVLIDAEPPKGILSDDRIVSILRDDGVDIARRTVAKYREAMGIPSSVQRRREKAARL